MAYQKGLCPCPPKKSGWRYGGVSTRRLGKQRGFTIRPRGGLSGIFDFPTAEDAVNYIKSKVGEFFGLPIRFKRALEKAARIKASAKARNDNATIAKAMSIELGVNKLKAGYPALEKRVQSLLDQLKSLGLGLIPLVVIGVAVSVAGAVAFQLTSLKRLEVELSAIEKGTVSEGFFKGKSLFGIDLSGMMLPVAAVAVGGFILMRKKR